MISEKALKLGLGFLYDLYQPINRVTVELVGHQMDGPSENCSVILSHRTGEGGEGLLHTFSGALAKKYFLIFNHLVLNGPVNCFQPL